MWLISILVFVVGLTLCTGCSEGSLPSATNSAGIAGKVEEGEVVSREVEDGGVVANTDREKTESYFAAIAKAQSVDEETRLLKEFGAWLTKNGYKIRVEKSNGKQILSCPFFPPVTPWMDHNFLDEKNLKLLPLLKDGE